MRTKERVKQLGEVFTPRPLVLKMLKQLPADIWSDPDKTWGDITGCGNGAFLVPVVHLRIRSGVDPLRVLQTTYGIDIMQDNVDECRERMLARAEQSSGLTRTQEWIDAVARNVVCADALTFDFTQWSIG